MTATLLEVIRDTPGWGEPERRVGGRLSWPCRLPGHTGYPLFSIGEDGRAARWACSGSCGTGDVSDFLRIASAVTS